MHERWLQYSAVLCLADDQYSSAQRQTNDRGVVSGILGMYSMYRRKNVSNGRSGPVGKPGERGRRLLAFLFYFLFLFFLFSIFREVVGVLSGWYRCGMVGEMRMLVQYMHGTLWGIIVYSELWRCGTI